MAQHTFSHTHPAPLPHSWQECCDRGWNELDILLVSGDAYVDHPSFGIALIGRLLEQQGYRVAILAQPVYDTNLDFSRFPTPRLFVGITGGNLDSIVANYSGNGKVRDKDAYSPGGSPWRSADQQKNNRFRPDRATLIYANLAKATFKETPIILGGVEASLRRFVHYDYKQDKLRASFLTDAKADILVYGMGERAVIEIADRLHKGLPLHDIAGTCERLTDNQAEQRFLAEIRQSQQKIHILPSLQEILADKRIFMAAEQAIDSQSRAISPAILCQRQQNHWVIQHPPAPPLTTEELDRLYELPYTRKPHPSTPDIPAYRMIKDSITIVRGCSGNCSFCAITRHQGAVIQNRSIESVVRECRELASQKEFLGTISDLGGPTANLFGTSCAIGSCNRKDCLYPSICRHLTLGENRFLALLKQVSDIQGIEHLFVSSGLRMELLLHTPKLLTRILHHHTPGALKIAPEHSCDEVLKLMHKEPHALLKRFVNTCRQLTSGQVRLTPYIISAHPGCTETHARRLARDMAALDLPVTKFQDFTPTPGTISTAMYVTGTDQQGKKIFVAEKSEERMRQRRIIEERFLKKRPLRSKEKTTRHKRRRQR